MPKIHKWRSIKLLQYYCNRLEFILMHHFEKLTFVAKLHNSDDDIKICLAYFNHSNELKTLIVRV